MTTRDPKYGPSRLVEARKVHRQMRLMEETHRAWAESRAIGTLDDVQERLRDRLTQGEK